MSSKEISQVFSSYQKSRITFVQTVAELVKQPRNIESMMQKETGVMELLRPLLLDTEPSVQQSAAMALGRLANYSEQLAERVVTSEILPQLVYSLSNENKYYKRSAAYVIRSVAVHSPVLAQAVVDSGAVEALVECLSQFDPGVKEAAAVELAQAVVDQDPIPLLLLCAKEPELSLKRIAVQALAHICSHSQELAQAVVDAEGIPDIAPLIENSKVKKQACSCLSHIAKHSVELAELVVEGEIFPKIFALLKDTDDPLVRKNAATCIREIAKHTPTLSSLIVNAGGLPAIVDYVSEAEEDSKLPGIMTLGFVSAFTDTMASSVIKAKAIPPLGLALSVAASDHVKAASAWTLGQIGRHSSEHARAVAEGNIFPKLMEAYLSPKSSDDLKAKSKRSLKFIIQKCVYLDALFPLLHEKAPQNILKYVVKQYAKVLPNDIDAKRRFAESRGLAKLQLIKTDDDELMETIKLINTCYPDEIVKYYSPGYDKELLSKIDEEN
ncbi:HEAT repeat-containing protein [Acrasis kona]|uniref:HEAT repeat-containing protein n=1 Tax=Acrasis kona TaxID=1008807 RepID=A0AAW2Z6J9_9EUKA